ncbi:hypothetical protein LDO31_14905 [Luteimonas sp. XNQY3]|nr:hypothetical protein [Luteimonas sp. XNQY3]MCD9007507.1 hypothetical protein [Luteimonas sp. XNQY3]
MDKKTQEHLDHLDDEFEPIELGSVYEETKGSIGQVTEGAGPNSMPL